MKGSNLLMWIGSERGRRVQAAGAVWNALEHLRLGSSGCPEGLPTAPDSREEDDRGHDNLRKRNILCVVPKLQIHILERK